MIPAASLRNLAIDRVATNVPTDTVPTTIVPTNIGSECHGRP
ncbi:hypothetical protein M2351_008083 [Azospirillum canadense]|nr:hypothetical protein [Azospirillum canadense]